MTNPLNVRNPRAFALCLLRLMEIYAEADTEGRNESAPSDLAGSGTHPDQRTGPTPAVTVGRRQTNEAPVAAGASQKPRRARGGSISQPNATAQRSRRASAEKVESPR